MTICTSALTGPRTLFCIFLLLLYSAVFSQDTSKPAKDTSGVDSISNKLRIDGTVSLAGGGADLSGTSVQIKGTTIARPTDSAGHFTILVSPQSTLVFSHVGYKTTEVTVDSKLPINITLTREENMLEQVTVSYGRQAKRDITGAISKVDAASVADIPATEFGQKLQGKVPGIQIQQSSGIPGNNIVFRIRGAASLGSGNQPLIVVDGQPLNSDVAGGTGDINLIAPDQIESYSVLKDANATALYGSRASNGVILITTRTAKIGKSSVSVNAYHGWQTVPQRGRPDMMNARAFATFMNGFYQDKITYEGWVNPTTGTATIPSDYANPSAYGKGTDWYNALIHTAPIDNYTVNFSLGTQKVSTSTTMNYFNQDGVLYNTGTKRFAFRTNTEYRPVERLKIGLNLAPAYQIDHNTRGGQLALNGNRQVVSGAEMGSPLIPVFRAPGAYTLSTSSFGMYAMPNYVMQARLMDNDQTNFSFLGNAYADLEIIRGLHAKSSINGDILNQDYNAYYGTMYGQFGNVPPRPNASSQAQNSANNVYSWTNENLLTYNTRLGDHSLDILAGYTTQKSYTTLKSITGTGFATDLTPFISAATNTSGSSNSTSWTIASALARINYDYKKRYYLSASIRNDGSSRFGTNKKYGTFPSVSAGWVASSEKFFPQWGALNYLKIRASYGKTGNFNIGNYTQASLLSPANYGNTTLGEGNTVLGNPDLTWETSKQFDIGADLTLLHGRVNISYDYYNTRNEGMLSQLPLPYTSGYESIQYNEGSFHIWGHDIQVSTDNIKGPFTWNTDFNISFNDNKVVSLVNNTPIGGVDTYGDYNRTEVGRRIGELYGYVFDGVYMNQSEYDKYPKYATSVVGSARMRDVNGDDTVDIKDRTFLGRTNPKFIYGMTNTFTWKNFDLGILVAGQVGNKIMNTNLQNIHNLDGVFNVTSDMANRWRSEADPGNGKVPGTRSGSTELYRLVNSSWVFSGDYLAVKNISLGYTFNKKVLRYVKDIRIYGSVQNAFMFTKYPGQNPEVNDTKDNQTQAGLDNGSYPIPRLIMVGANLNF
ncbi:TonB-dependent receptor [Flavitalea sp. BT771]|uniref:SusC/RagA family TonB-linked outer membrane protein n=1 Tax=Flavitalea sp. BT771 TaxID=3063329 RepID=UPI0026E1BD13|nr:TonB-dependent receptor [Flavitalea sp. BT771]MDO6428998.1 TonB-dependent receptor [Flavitalea sp. BT771]MDV6218874.1 TonB-dependent receptor [Flavitalea sp. BT771]